MARILFAGPAFKKVIISLVVLILPLVTTGVALAATSQPKTTALAKTQTINNDYFATGGTVEISGTVNGDVYATGGQIVIDGTVNGDVLALGGTLTISGTVNGNVRAAVGQVNISGTVSRNVTLGGGTLELSRAGVINGNLVAGGGTLLVSGKVGKDITAGTGSLTVTGSVGGKIDVAVGQLTIGSTGTVAGPLTYWSSSDASISSGAKTGKVVHNLPTRDKEPDTIRSLDLWSRFYWLAVTLLVGALLFVLLPNHTRSVIKTMETRSWASLGIGFAGLILVPIASIILLITLLGAPLAVIGIVLYGVALFLAPIWTVLAIGHIVSKTLKVKDTSSFMLLAGVLVYALLGFIPVVSGIVSFVGLLLGLGAFWLANVSLFNSLRQENKI